MCLAIPGEIVEVTEGDLRTGRVSFGGVTKEICLAFVPEARVGDYVLVHAGFAIAQVSEAHAHETIKELERLGDDGA